MKENNLDVTKMEFLLTLNDNIVVQRYYNVKNYNEQAKNSYSMVQLMSSFKEDIHQDLKAKSCYFLLDNSEQIMLDPQVLSTSNTDGPENFNMYLKVGDMTICHLGWDAKIYPPKIRYTVDVRPHLKTILKRLTDIFSGENLVYDYMNYQLA
jgi:hypothetical protein